MSQSDAPPPLIVALLTVLAPADASASTPVARETLLDGPQLAGGRVLWMTGVRDAGYALWAAAPGARPRIVARGGRALSFRRFSFDAASGRIGAMRSRISLHSDSGVSDPSAGVLVEYHRSRLEVGENPRDLASLAECSGFGTSFPYAVGTAFVAFAGTCPASDVDDPGFRRLRYVDVAGETRTWW